MTNMFLIVIVLERVIGRVIEWRGEARDGTSILFVLGKSVFEFGEKELNHEE